MLTHLCSAIWMAMAISILLQRCASVLAAGTIAPTYLYTNTGQGSLSNEQHAANEAM